MAYKAPRSYDEADRSLARRGTFYLKPDSRLMVSRVDRFTAGVFIRPTCPATEHRRLVTWHKSGKIVLCAFGDRTPDLKTRLNRCLPVGVKIRQRAGVWYVEDRRAEATGGKPALRRFVEGMPIREPGWKAPRHIKPVGDVSEAATPADIIIGQAEETKKIERDVAQAVADMEAEQRYQEQIAREEAERIAAAAARRATAMNPGGTAAPIDGVTIYQRVGDDNGHWYRCIFVDGQDTGLLFSANNSFVARPVACGWRDAGDIEPNTLPLRGTAYAGLVSVRDRVRAERAAGTAATPTNPSDESEDRANPCEGVEIRQATNDTAAFFRRAVFVDGEYAGVLFDVNQDEFRAQYLRIRSWAGEGGDEPNTCWLPPGTVYAVAAIRDRVREARGVEQSTPTNPPGDAWNPSHEPCEGVTIMQRTGDTDQQWCRAIFVDGEYSGHLVAVGDSYREFLSLANCDFVQEGRVEPNIAPLAPRQVSRIIEIRNTVRGDRAQARALADERERQAGDAELLRYLQESPATATESPEGGDSFWNDFERAMVEDPWGDGDRDSPAPTTDCLYREFINTPRGTTSQRPRQ